MTADRSARDQTDRMLEEWAAVRPGLDTAPVAVVSRLRRAANLLGPLLERPFAERGMTKADFELLSTLRRSPGAAPVGQGEIGRRLALTASTVSARAERLVRMGLIAREQDGADRRGVCLRLTVEGRRRVDEAVEAHVANERELVASLDPAERDQLAALLRRFVLGLEAARAQEDAA